MSAMPLSPPSPASMPLEGCFARHPINQREQVHREFPTANASYPVQCPSAAWCQKSLRSDAVVARHIRWLEIVVSAEIRREARAERAQRQAQGVTEARR